MGSVLSIIVCEEGFPLANRHVSAIKRNRQNEKRRERNQAIVLETLHSRFPVLDAGDDVAGILATKDLATALLQGKQEIWSSLDEFLRPALMVPEALLISSLLERMRSARQRMAIVIDEHGNYIGIVTLEDMIEEIVGEMEDEWDTEAAEAMIVPVKTGWKVNGQVPLSKLSEETDVSIETVPNATTLAGYVMDRLGRVPKEGDQFTDGDFRFRVAKMDGRIVQVVMIDPAKTSKSKDQDDEHD